MGEPGWEMREHGSLRVEGGGSLSIARSPARASRRDSPPFGVSIEQDPALDQQNWVFEVPRERTSPRCSPISSLTRQVSAVQAYGLRCADRKCICEAPSADGAGRAGSSSRREKPESERDAGGGLCPPARLGSEGRGDGEGRRC